MTVKRHHRTEIKPADQPTRWLRPRLTSLQARRRAAQPCLQALAGGATLRAAAGAAGVHVATVCRWRQVDRSLEVLFQIVSRLGGQARKEQKERRLRQAALQNYPVEFHELVKELPLAKLDRPRLRVAWSRCCPLCNNHVEVKARGAAGAFGVAAAGRTARLPAGGPGHAMTAPSAADHVSGRDPGSRRPAAGAAGECEQKSARAICFWTAHLFTLAAATMGHFTRVRRCHRPALAEIHRTASPAAAPLGERPV